MNLDAGTLLAGRYRLERRLGMGGMGEVWAAKNTTVGTDVAVKLILPDAAAKPEIVMRFRREALLLARIKNDHVARVLDFVADELAGPVLVMDLVGGEPMSEVLARSRLSVEDAIDVAVDVLRGLLDLHRANVVHRDIKPGNVILETRGDGTRKAVIVDFGLGRIMAGDSEDSSGITRRDTAVGTLEYMAPEQILNSSGVTGAADIYALGAMLYRAVAGAHMFGARAGGELAKAKLIEESPDLRTGRSDKVAQGFERIVATAVRRDRAERYAKAEVMLEELLRLRAQIPRAVVDEEGPTLLFPQGAFRALGAALLDPPPGDDDELATVALASAPPPPAIVKPHAPRPPLPPPAAAKPAPSKPPPARRDHRPAVIAASLALVVGFALGTVVGSRMHGAASSAEGAR